MWFFCFVIDPQQFSSFPYDISWSTITNNKQIYFLLSPCGCVRPGMQHKSEQSTRILFNYVICHRPTYWIVVSNLKHRIQNELHTAPPVNEIFSNRARNNLSMTIMWTIFFSFYARLLLIRIHENLFHKSCVFVFAANVACCGAGESVVRSHTDFTGDGRWVKARRFWQFSTFMPLIESGIFFKEFGTNHWFLFAFLSASVLFEYWNKRCRWWLIFALSCLLACLPACCFGVLCFYDGLNE